MKQILSCLMIVFTFACTQAQEKVFLAETEQGEKYYIYPSTIRKSNFGITMWSETVYAKPKYIGSVKKYATSDKLQRLIDCDGMKNAITSLIYYSKNGNIVEQVSISEFEASLRFEPVLPESIGWAVVEEICKRYK